jgi:chromosome segregation ATPase
MEENENNDDVRELKNKIALLERDYYSAVNILKEKNNNVKNLTLLLKYNDGEIDSFKKKIKEKDEEVHYLLDSMQSYEVEIEKLKQLNDSKDILIREIEKKHYDVSKKLCEKILYLFLCVMFFIISNIYYKYFAKKLT